MPIDLKTENQREPLGLDTTTPRFSWKIKPEPGRRGQWQQAYRILVSRSPELLKEGQVDVGLRSRGVGRIDSGCRS